MLENLTPVRKTKKEEEEEESLRNASEEKQGRVVSCIEGRMMKSTSNKIPYTARRWG